MIKALKTNWRNLLIILTILIVIFWRFYYWQIAYNFTFSSWDSTWYIVRWIQFMNYFFLDGLNMTLWKTSSNLIWAPFIIPYMLAIFSKVTWMYIWDWAKLITWLSSLFFLWILYKFLILKLNFRTTTLIILAIGTNSYFTLYSTEPSREIFILFYFIISLYLLIKKNLVLSSIYLITFTYLIHSTWIVSIITYWTIYIHKKRVFNFKNLNFKHILYWLIFLLHGIILMRFLKEVLRYDTKLATWFWASMTHAEWEIDAAINNIKSWFKSSWFKSLTLWIQRQTWKAIYYLWILFIIINLLKRKKINYFATSFLVIYLFFWIKRIASSHWSRYPTYLNWLIIIIFFSWVHTLNDVSRKIISILSLFYLTINYSYFNNNLNIREVYELNKTIWIDIGKNININKDNKLLYMWRPDTELWILESTKNYNEENYITYWWLYYDSLDIIDHNFIKKHKISYFLYEKTWKDYYWSYDILKKKFRNELTLIKEINKNNKYVGVFKFNK